MFQFFLILAGLTGRKTACYLLTYLNFSCQLSVTASSRAHTLPVSLTFSLGTHTPSTQLSFSVDTSTFASPSPTWCHLKSTFEILWPFCLLFALTCERVFIKTHSIEARCVIGLKRIAVCRCVCASFSLEILQAEAVKGFKLKPFGPHSFVLLCFKAVESVTFSPPMPSNPL